MRLVRVAVVLSVLLPATLRAQALAGRVVDATTRRPVRGVAVRLVTAVPSGAAPTDTAAAASTVTAEDGAFMLIAPRPDTYQARIGASYVSAPIVLASSDAYSEQEFAVALTDSGVVAGAPADVAEPARILPGPAVRELSRRGGFRLPANRIRVWQATVEVVIDSAGRPEAATARVVRASTDDFGEAARRYVVGSSFIPAKRGDRPVRQLAQVPVTVDLRNMPTPSLPPGATLPSRRPGADVRTPR